MRAFRLQFLLLIAAAAIYAQNRPPTAEPTSTKVDGHVFSSDGSGIGGATVTISSPTAKPPSQTAAAPPGQAASTPLSQSAVTPPGQSTYVEVTSSGTDAGKYGFPDISAGTYDITVGKSEYLPQTRKAVVVNSSQQRIDFVLEPACSSCSSGRVEAGRRWNALGTLLAVLLFLASIWLVRWHNIAQPNRKLLNAEVEKQRARFQNETGSDLATVTYLNVLLELAKAPSWSWRSWDSWCDFLFWTRGQEITGWARIHEFQRNTIKQLPAGSLDMVRARLQTVELELLDIDKTHA
ncbi:MAG: carboxypeptidase-like regulatory domain-containing protein, partial [Bryobacteraceae bacterium]